MKRLTLLLFALLFSVTAHLQPTIEWQKAFGGSVDEYGNRAIQTADGGYLLAGGAYSSNGDVSLNFGESDCWIVKTDNAGTLQWEKSYGGSLNDEISSVIQTADGGYAFCAVTGSSDGDVSGAHGNFDIWVVKLTAAGDTSWTLTIGGSESDHPQRILQAADGSYYVFGFTMSADGDFAANAGASDFFVANISAAGALIMTNTFGGSGYDEAMWATPVYDGGFLIAGNTNSADLASALIGGYDYWIVKITTAGNIQWENTYGGTDDDWPNSVITLGDSTFVIAGSSASTDVDVAGNHGGYYDAWVIHIDTAGTLLWSKALGGSGDDRAYGADTSATGEILIAGFTDSGDGDVSGVQGNYDYWAINLSTAGLTLWTITTGGSDEDLSGSIIHTSDGGIVQFGNSRSTDGNVTGQHGTFGGADFWMVKFVPEVSIFSWSGVADTDWGNILNWNMGAVPGAGDIVVIENTANQPVVDGNYSCAEIMIRPMASITVNPAGNLAVAGDVFLESNSSGTAMILPNGTFTAGGDFRISQNITEGQAHFVSTPLTASLADVFTGGTLEQYDEGLHFWDFLMVGDPLSVMKGYRAEFSGSLSRNVQFSGIPNNGAQSIALNYTDNATPADDGWNLCGNPYPSVADWKSAVGWTKTNVDNTIYYWDGVQYATYNATTDASTNGGNRWVPPMQGFMVKCNNIAGGTLGCDNNVRRVDVIQPFWKSDTLNGFISIAINGNGYSDELQVGFFNGATSGFDSETDAYKLWGISEAPQIYTLDTAQYYRMALNTLPFFAGNRLELPLGVRFPDTSTYEFIFSYIPNEYQIRLIDTLFHHIYYPESGISVQIPGDTLSAHERFILVFSRIPIVNAGQDTAVCYGDSVILSVNSYEGYRFVWTEASNPGVILEEDTALFAVSGYTYIISAIDLADSTSFSDTITVEGLALPQISIFPSDTTICFHDTVIFCASGNGDFLWGSGQTTQCLAIESDTMTPGAYLLAVEITDSSGCQNHTTATLTIDVCGSVNDLHSDFVSVRFLPGREIYLYSDQEIAAEVSDMKGAIVFRSSVSAGGNTILLPGMPEAIYFLKLSNGEKTKTIKFQIR
ncbi:MAG: T9SS type A sorting domain-containing protein [Bacteroidetes bacterium]|nr:T9SS type A sorting domain-containing protein [Bacteroidota bacterium]MBU1720667.1 T9SS type A sorting domain-containing protein [Bacteroidota bacterium]